MEDIKTKAYFSSFFALLVLAAGLADATVNLEHFSSDEQIKLERDFKKASWDSTDVDLLKAQKTWTCDMFGVRSRMQVKRGVKLYAWNLAKDQVSWENDGAQPVIQYHSKAGRLEGKSSRFEDEVKVTGKGQLISRLTVTQPKRMVVAYSVCKDQ